MKNRGHMNRGQTECEWTRDICAGLQRCGAVVFSNHVNRFAPRGWPDRWVGHVVWSGWLEFKGFDTAVEPLQAKRVREICERWPGGAWIVRRCREGEGTSIALQDADGKTCVRTQDHAEGLLLALLSAQLKTSSWIEAQQIRISQVADRLCALAEARGDECCAYLLD